MYRNSNTYDRDYDNRDNHSSWTRGFGIGMGYSGGAGEAKKGETSERIGDYRDDRYYGNTGFSGNYGSGTNYSYGTGYPYNTTASHLSTYPTHYDSNRYDLNRYDSGRYSNNYGTYGTNQYSGYANAPTTGYRTVQETREIVRDSDRPFGHSNVYPHSGWNRDYNRYDSDRVNVTPHHGFNHYGRSDNQYSLGYGNTDRHYSTSNYGRF